MFSVVVLTYYICSVVNLNIYTFNFMIKKLQIITLLLFLALLPQCSKAQGTVSTVNTFSGNAYAIFYGKSDTIYYSQNFRIYKMAPPYSTATVLAGSGSLGFADATGTSAQMGYVYGLLQDAAGNIIFTDYNYNRLRKLSPSGVVSTIAIIPSGPIGITWGNNDTLIATSYSSTNIYKIAPSGAVSTFSTTALGSSVGITKGNNDTLFIACYGGHRIYKIDPLGNYHAFVGSGTAGYVDATGSSAQFYYPSYIVIDGSNMIYVSDFANHTIRQISASGVVSTYTGNGTAGTTDGTGTATRHSNPFGMTIDSASGDLYVADRGSARLRRITGPVALPLEWLAYNARINPYQQAQLSWQVTEKGVAHYQVLKSTDGIQFERIAQLGSKGEGTQNYSYTEPSPLKGTAFYRIVQQDFDGRESYSPTRVLSPSNTQTQVSLEVMGNPVTSAFRLKSYLEQKVVLYNNLGQEVLHSYLSVGVNTIDINHLASGLYILQAADGSNYKMTKE